MDQVKIARLVLNYKLDESGRIWFLFCSSLRIEDEELRESVF